MFTRRRKRMVFALAATLTIFLAFPLTSCGTNAVFITAMEINEASTLPMPLLTSNAEANPAFYEDYIDNFMSNDYYGMDYMLSFSGFPTDTDPYYLTWITWTGKYFNLFGIKVGDDPEEAAETIKARGFAQTGSGYYGEFTKKGITVRLIGDKAIEKIEIQIPSAYVSGNLY